MWGFIIFYWAFSSIVTFAMMRTDDCSWFESIFGGVLAGVVFFPLTLGVAFGKILKLKNNN